MNHSLDIAAYFRPLTQDELLSAQGFVPEEVPPLLVYEKGALYLNPARATVVNRDAVHHAIITQGRLSEREVPLLTSVQQAD